MPSTKQRAPKGSVRIKSSNNRLQLVFSVGSKRHYLSLGLPDTKVNRRAAEAKAKLIESDIAYERFDPTLDKYRFQRETQNDDTEANEPNLDELWQRFIIFKTPQLSPNTLKYQYGPFSNYVKRLPSHKLEDATRIRDWVIQNVPLESGKRFITRLSACCKWAKQSGFIANNPFQGMASDIKVPKSTQGKGINDIFPFTIEERDRILTALASNQFCSQSSGYKHSIYKPLIQFLFKTGCRPSEAVALEWKHIAADFSSITFEQALISTESGRRIRAGLKTQENRTFPCNDSLKALLQNLHATKIEGIKLVFCGPTSKPVDLNNFRNRVWKKILQSLGIEYRKLYQCRHSFITEMLDRGVDAKDVGRLVGNSPETIYRHYAGSNRKLVVPEF